MKNALIPSTAYCCFGTGIAGRCYDAASRKRLLPTRFFVPCMWFSLFTYYINISTKIDKNLCKSAKFVVETLSIIPD